MTKYVALLVFMLICTSAMRAADGLESVNTPKRDLALLDIKMVVGQEQSHHLSLDFTNIDSQTIIALYAKLSGLELVTDSHASVVRTPISVQAYDLTSAQMISLVEQGLKEQAGIIITRLDDKRVAVTYDSSLPIKKPKH